jgi:outer membrane protein OmpA-like peptidoglycan-associated protein
VLDHLDACPSTPAGDTADPARPGCPDPDTDGDRVTDGVDACPREHASLHPDPDRPGCPLPDRDHDSVIDEDDTCPDIFGSPSPDPSRHGCPGLVRIEGGVVRILQPVFFATARDRILPRSRGVLQAVADALAATPEIRRMTIDGHTDDVGDDGANLELSERRARNVMAWLVEHGIAASRLEAHGYGESRPLQRGRSTRARSVNRRVMFRILDPALQDDETAPEADGGSR